MHVPPWMCVSQLDQAVYPGSAGSALGKTDSLFSFSGSPANQ